MTDIFAGDVISKWLNGVRTNFSINKDVIKTTFSTLPKQHFDVRHNAVFLYFFLCVRNPSVHISKICLFFSFPNSIICLKQMSSFQMLFFHRFLHFISLKINHLNSNSETDGISHSEQTFSIPLLFLIMYFMAFVEDSAPPLRSLNYTFVI